MHGREKSVSPNTKKWIKKHPDYINASLLEHQQALLDPSCYQLREQWLNQELSELDRKQPVLSDYIKDFIKELLAICLEDLKLMNVPLLAGQYLIKYSVWTGNSFFIEGFIEKLLLLRICDPLCPNSLRENALTVLTVLHCLDIIKTPDSYYPELEIAPNNRFVSTNKYLESFFKILNELIKSASLNLQPDIQVEDSNSDMDENISHSESEESSEEVSFSEELDSKDSFLDCIIHSWCSLVSLVSEDTFDNELPGAYEIFNGFVRYHKNVTIKIVACEAIITLSDLNERLPLEKKYDIEIQPLVDLLHKYSNKITNTANHKSRLIWLNLAKALEAEKCVVQLPFIYMDRIQNKVSSPLSKNKMDTRKQNQNKNKRETLWTNWTEAITVKFIKNSLGHLFNQLMSHNPEFGNRVLSLLENRDSWHLSYQNVPLSMVYIQMTVNNSSKISTPKRSKNTDKLSNDWSKFNQ